MEILIFKPATYRAQTWSWASIVGRVMPRNIFSARDCNILSIYTKARIEPIKDEEPAGQKARCPNLCLRSSASGEAGNAFDMVAFTNFCSLTSKYYPNGARSGPMNFRHSLPYQYDYTIFLC